MTDQLYAAAYDQIRCIAARLMQSQPLGHSLHPTELVHEAYAKLVNSPGFAWVTCAHFLAVASKAMRQILVDYARRRATQKRGGHWQRITLSDIDRLGEEPELSALELHEALGHLETKDARMAKLVELRAFAGLTAEEAARVLGISKRTADTEWKIARLWLAKAMRP